MHEMDKISIVYNAMMAFVCVCKQKSDNARPRYVKKNVFVCS